MDPSKHGDQLRMAAPLNHQPSFLRMSTIAIILLLLLGVLGFLGIRNEYNYRQAQQLAAAGEYRQAAQQFQKFSSAHYKDSDAWFHYCQAQISCEKGHFLDAARQMDKAIFRHLNPEQKAEMDAFRSELRQKQQTAQKRLADSK